MKKTLTVNLGGTVFNIDEDAYRLLDNYLCNLKLYFKRQQGAEEIINDIETRISELFSEKISSGSQVITIADAEEVIARMGKPEEISGSYTEEPGINPGTTAKETVYRKKLYRNPDDRILGGVAGGLAAYLGWDVTIVRLLMVALLIFGFGAMVPIYVVCWIVIPEAQTAAEKLNMRGENVTIENIGKSVTGGFEKAANGVNDYISSGKPRTLIQKLGDLLISVIGVALKASLILLGIVLAPLLFGLAVACIALAIAAIAVAAGGGAALINMLPLAAGDTLITIAPVTAIMGSIAGIVLAGIPIAGLVYLIIHLLFKLKPISTGVKISLTILWIIALITLISCLSVIGWHYPFLHVI